MRHNTHLKMAEGDWMDPCKNPNQSINDETNEKDARGFGGRLAASLLTSISWAKLMCFTRLFFSLPNCSLRCPNDDPILSAWRGFPRRHRLRLLNPYSVLLFYFDGSQATTTGSNNKENHFHSTNNGRRTSRDGSKSLLITAPSRRVTYKATTGSKMSFAFISLVFGTCCQSRGEKKSFSTCCLTSMCVSIQPGFFHRKKKREKHLFVVDWVCDEINISKKSFKKTWNGLKLRYPKDGRVLNKPIDRSKKKNKIKF